MNTIPITSIIIKPDRQRRDFDPKALMDLTESIRDHGLFHAPVLRKENEAFVLVAGERRIRAIRDLFSLGDTLRYDGQIIQPGHIPFVLLNSLDQLSVEEAELDENLHRVNLNWQEHADAVSRLESLRSKQAAISGATVTVADIAEEVTGRRDGDYQANVRKELIVAKHLSDPDVCKAKSLKEAFQILKRKEEAEKGAILAENIRGIFSAANHRLFQGDCIDWLRRQEPGQFDVICTDPPYGMNADKFAGGFSGAQNNLIHNYDDSSSTWQKLMQEWCPLSFAITKPEAHAYISCDFDKFHKLKDMMQAAGWYVFRTPLIQYKLGFCRVPLPDLGPSRQYELVLYAIKGKKKTTRIYPDVIPCSADKSEEFGAQKPIEFVQNLLQRSCVPGNTVLDTFAGTGPIFQAAHNLQCYATGIEQLSYQFKKAYDRLEAIKGNVEK